MSESGVSHFLRDLGPLLLELARSARSDAERTGDGFDRGRAHGLYEAVSLMTQQVDAFDLDRSQVGLGGVEPDRDLL